MDSIRDKLRLSFLAVILVSHIIYNPTNSGAVTLTQQTIDLTLASNELVIINFYVNWSRINYMLYDEAADKVTEIFPDAGKVVMAKVDCDKESAIAIRFRLTKYPTFKVIRNGHPDKGEFKGQISVEGFVSFVKKQLEDPIKEFHSIKELSKLESSKRIIIGYFDRRDQHEYNMFRRVAGNFKDDCQFHVGFGNASEQMHSPGQPVIVYKPDKNDINADDDTYMGKMDNFDEMHGWILNKCVPAVREITFENAEDITVEGLPFFILYHKSDDNESIKKYNEVVQSELLSERQNINFLTADGKTFAHTLRHVGKGESDLPLIAIDSFKHIYLFPNFKDIDDPGKLKQFIQDLYSGKLHREFHYGPDLDDANKNVKALTTPPFNNKNKNVAPSKILFL
ncbi:PREDICTED: endoplasmic reticulum resident protein 44-like, partial [Nicrophorus vespilloides]|uniref:Endoplasmic reticulum resident protein 44-like n=1 Tax=Nicrophorus vespilloides TaxID=110193 RepID=A0ABM1M9S0_NICVS